MKAAQLVSYGGEDAIKVSEDVAKPGLSSDQVLVKVHALGLNPFEWKIREGYMQEFIPLELPVVIGGDLAGVVVEIGEDVTGFEVGQAVYGMANSVGGHGSYAEYAPVAASQLYAKPASIDFVEAGALPLVSISAYQALVDSIGLQPGQKILIHGGGGGIGSVAIQIAKNLGAYVATTVSKGDLEYVKELGADEAIDYQAQDFSEILSDYDAVFDNVGGETNKKSYAVLKQGGKFVSMADPKDDALVAEKAIEYFQQMTQPTSERLGAISELVEAGKLKVNIDKVYSLDEAPEALEYLKTGHPRGKVVVKIQD